MIINDNTTPECCDIREVNSSLTQNQDMNNRLKKTGGNQNRSTAKINNSNKDTSRNNRSTISTKIIKGTRETTEEHNTLCGIKQRVWLHIGKIQLGTASEVIEKHLKQCFPGRSFIIDELKQRAGGTSMSFKVGGDLDLIDDLYDGGNWPSGVTVRRFFFQRYAGKVD